MGYTPPVSIDVGVEAISRANGSNNHTMINEGNPANESGTITQIEIYLQSAVTALQVAIFEEVSSEHWTTRSVHDCGALASGYHAIAVNLEVVAGDHIGAYANQYLQYDTSGGSGIYVGTGDFVPCTNEEMTNQVGSGMVSLYGTGNTGNGELTIGESFSTVDSLVKNGTLWVAEAFNTIDSWVARLLFGEAFSISDSVVKSAVKQLAETLSTVDSWIARLNLSETFSIGDSFIRSCVKNLADTLNIVDSKSTNISKSLNESFTITDSWTAMKRFTETLKVADSIIKKHIIMMMIRKIIIRVRGGSYESDIELED